VGVGGGGGGGPVFSMSVHNFMNDDYPVY